MGRPIIDLTGQHFGHLTVISYIGNNPAGEAKWLCLCSCGKQHIVLSSGLRSGKTKSCGCIRKKHGGRKTRLYRIWIGMKSRCFDAKFPSFPDYGGRGITVCDEWTDNFSAFQKWSVENGYDENAPKGLCTLDRIDVNGNYSPENCRWANMMVQSNNQRKNRHLTVNGETKTIAEWSREYNIKLHNVYNRLNYGWSIEEALELVPRRKKEKKQYGK